MAGYEKINASLVGLKFKRSIANYILYFAQDGPHVIFVLVYVDDLILISTLTRSTVALKATL